MITCGEKKIYIIIPTNKIYEIYIMENLYIYMHYYAPENQIIQFFLNNNIPILCYRDYCYVR